jgi:hypothetical protein
MNPITSGICRFCGCVGDDTHRVPPYGEDDTCAWVQGSMRTVCNAPGCVAQWREHQRAAVAATLKRLTSADVNKLIRRRGRKRKGRAA